MAKEYTPLMRACELGKLDAVKAQLDRGANPNELNEDGHSALFYAAKKGHAEIVEALLIHGAEVDHRSYLSKHRSDQQIRAIDLAAQNGHPDVVKKLLEYRANTRPDSDKKIKSTADIAITAGQYEIIRLLIDEGAYVGSDELVRLTGSGKDELIKYVLERKKDDRYAYPLLNSYARLGNKEMVNYLLEYAQTNAGEKEYFDSIFKTSLTDALERASKGGHYDIAKLLLEKGATADEKALTAACINRQLNIVNLLLEKGARPSQETIEAAARSGNAEITKAILTNSGQEVPSEEALKAAVENNNFDNAKQLLERGANANCGALLIAAHHRNNQIIELLLSHGADVNYKAPYMHRRNWPDNYKMGTALNIALHMLAVHEKPDLIKQDMETITLLLDKGANPNLPSCIDQIGWEGCEISPLTLVTIACTFGNDKERMVESLLDKGADINQPISRDGSKYTALDLAENYQKNSPEEVQKVIDILRNRGAKTYREVASRGPLGATRSQSFPAEAASVGQKISVNQKIQEALVNSHGNIRVAVEALCKWRASGFSIVSEDFKESGLRILDLVRLAPEENQWKIDTANQLLEHANRVPELKVAAETMIRELGGKVGTRQKG